MVVPIILILGNVGAVFRKFETLKTTVNIGELVYNRDITW